MLSSFRPDARSGHDNRPVPRARFPIEQVAGAWVPHLGRFLDPAAMRVLPNLSPHKAFFTYVRSKNMHDMRCDHQTSLRVHPPLPLPLPPSCHSLPTRLSDGGGKERVRGQEQIEKCTSSNSLLRVCHPVERGINDGLFQEVTWVRTFPIAGDAISVGPRMSASRYLPFHWDSTQLG